MLLCVWLSAAEERLVPDPDASFERFMLVYANLHSHTDYSDARSLDPSDRFNPATPEHVVQANLDRNEVLALTDHGEHLSSDEWVRQGELATQRYTSNRVLLRGFELTGTEEPPSLDAKINTKLIPGWGHLIILSSTEYCGTKRIGNGNPPVLIRSYQEALDWLGANEQALGIFAHPDLYSVNSFNGYGPPPNARAVDQMVGCELATHGIIERTLGNGKDLASSNEACFRRLLANGWKLGAVMSGDEHTPIFGDAPTVTGLYVDQATSRGVVEALRYRRIFATTDRRASIKLIAQADHVALMGETLKLGQEDVLFHAVCESSASVSSIRLEFVAQYPAGAGFRLSSQSLHTHKANFGTVKPSDFLRSQSIVAVYAAAHLVNGGELVSSPVFLSK